MFDRNRLARRIKASLTVLSAVIGVAGAGLLIPAAAQAGTTADTMTLQSELFPSGLAVPGGFSSTAQVAPGSTVTLTAPEYLTDSKTSAVYEFLFWNANGTAISTDTANVTAPSGGTAFTATAWYLAIGGPGCTTTCPPPAASTWAFSLTSNKVLPQTPIASVTPSSAWTSPSTSVSTATSSVTITAASRLGPLSKYSGTDFNSWLAFGGGTTISGLNLSVLEGDSPYGIAFYTQWTGSPPPICVGAPHCV